MATRLAGTAATFLVALALLSPLSRAEAPVLVEDLSPQKAEIVEGERATFQWRLYNLNSGTPFFVSVGVSGAEGAAFEVAPNRFFLQPLNETVITLTLGTGESRKLVSTVLEISLVNTQTGEVSVVEEKADVVVLLRPKVLYVFPNPLPPPLDNAYGVFLLDLAFWAGFALVSILTQDTIVRYLLRFARVDVVRVVIQKLRWPVFLLVFLLGLRDSVAVLPSNPVTDFTLSFLAAIALGFMGIYVVYRLLDAGLYYYANEIAPKTETNIDDVVVPVLRKFGLVVLVVVGVIQAIKFAGWDPSFFFAGAGIAGLVIAFAAQETISNLFSGIFLLLDRPFREGDYIKLETGEICRVERVGLRSTRLYFTRVHEIITLPNRELASRRVVSLNYPDERYRLSIKVGVSYGSDPRQVEETLLRVAAGCPYVDHGPESPARVYFIDFADSSLMFELRIFIRSFLDRNVAASELRFAIAEAFRSEGIEIPFPHRTLVVRGPDAPAVRTLEPKSRSAAPPPPPSRSVMPEDGE